MNIKLSKFWIMKLFYEFRCTRNGKCAHTEYLDCLVASLCHVPLDDKQYTIPAGNIVNWLMVVVSSLHEFRSLKLGTMDIVEMDFFLDAIEKDATGTQIDYKKPFVEIFKMFKRMDLCVHSQLIVDDDEVEKYKTKGVEKWFTLDELIQLKSGTPPIGLRYEPVWWPDRPHSYAELMDNQKIREDYSIYERDEHILIFTRKGWGEKEMYMVNTATQKVYHLVDRDGYIRTFTNDDIDPTVFEAGHTSRTTALIVEYAKLSVSQFKDGKATIEWMLYPDGRYFADEDGFGMEDNDEVNVAAVIDEDCKVIEKFKLVYEKL